MSINLNNRVGLLIIHTCRHKSRIEWVLFDSHAMHLRNKLRCGLKCTRISCRCQTCATSYITANVLQTNKVDAQCDKLATELSWQRFTSKIASFQLQQLHLTYPTCIWLLHWGWTRSNFAEIFGIRKLESLGLSWGVVCVILITFSRFSTTPTSDGQTDRQTQWR